MKRRRSRRASRFPPILAAVLLLVALAATIAWLRYRPDKTVLVATGMAAHILCSETFVSGLEPAEIYAQAIMPFRGLRLLAPHLHYTVDRANRDVSVDLAGYFVSHAAYRDGLGCLLSYDAAPPTDDRKPEPAAGEPLLPDIAGPAVVTPANPALQAALDRMFIEPADPPHRWVKAVVIVKDDRVVGERYAPGVGIDTPLLGFSASKSIINALVGILVRDGRLSVGARAPVPAWGDAGDKRHAITLDNLLRMTGGLAIAQTGSGFDPAARMLYAERDMAGYAEAAALRDPPGIAMQYSDASTLIVARIVRDAVGGTGTDVQRFARRALFQPLGMRSVVMEEDATGTPVGSTFILATARDWARFGLLYLDDGEIGGRRILPPGWVRYSSASTLGTSYGAGFWTNAGQDAGARGRIRGGMPCDTFFASGILGQRVYIIPSANLVIVRMGVTQEWPDFDITGDNRLIRAVVAALGPTPAPACATQK